MITNSRSESTELRAQQHLVEKVDDRSIKDTQVCCAAAARLGRSFFAAAESHISSSCRLLGPCSSSSSRELSAHQLTRSQRAVRRGRCCCGCAMRAALLAAALALDYVTAFLPLGTAGGGALLSRGFRTHCALRTPGRRALGGARSLRCDVLPEGGVSPCVIKVRLHLSSLSGGSEVQF